MSEKKTCFIIRPFSEPFNKRSEAVYKPAIRAAGLEPVEAGVPGNDKITDEIENGIRNAAICLADLTPVAKRDRKNETCYQYNFNVWYELGFAFACHRRAVMLFNTDIWPMERLPFDIKHRFVKSYKNSADSDEDARNGVIHAIIEDLQKKLKQIANSATQQSGVRSHAASADNATASTSAPQELVIENLNESDVRTLNRILSHWARYKEPHTFDSQFFDKTPVSTEFSIQKLEKDGFIVRQQFRVAHGIMTDIANGYAPTKRALDLARQNPHIFK